MIKRILLLLLLVLVVAGTGAAQDVSSRYQGQIIGSRGVPLANQNVAVCTQPANTNTQPCSPLASLGTSTATTTGGANPLVSDAIGNFFFYAPPGKYTVQIYGPQVGTQLVMPDTVMPFSTATSIVFSGNDTFSGTTTFQNIIQLSGGTCSTAGIIAALAAVAVGGTVDARACTTAFTWSSLVTIASPVTLWLPCANVTFTTQLLNITADDVHVHGCGAGGSGAISIYNSPNAGSVYTASGLGAGVNAIVAYKGAQGTLQAQRQSAFTLDNLIINMNGVGNRAISTSSCWSCKIDQVIIQNANCSDGAFFQEASNPAGLLLTESYFMHMDNVLVTIAQANTTCHPFMFDASRGEIAYATYTNLTGIGYPQAAGSGSDSVYINTGATSVSQSFDQNVFINLKTQDPTTGAFGIKLQARGNFGGTLASSFLRTNGAIFNVQFVDAQPERIFSTGGSGTGIGCVNAAGSADGTGCAFLANSNFSSGGWANNEDVPNLGAGYMSVSDNAAVLQGPIFRQSGLHNGSNSNFEKVDPTYQPTANGQLGQSIAIVPSTINPNNFTGNILYGLSVDLASGVHTGGNFLTAYGYQCNGFGSWATNEWCFYGVGPAGNHTDSWWEIGTASAANPGGVVNGGRFWYDQTNQRMSLSNNNLAFSFIPLLNAANTWTAAQTHTGAAIIPDQTVGITGTTTNNNANAGAIGEYIVSTIATGSSVALTTNVTANVTSISLTAGDWDVTGAVDFTFGATTSYTNLIGSVSTTTGTIGGQDSKFDFETPAAVPTAGADSTFSVPTVRFSLSGTTTIFLVAQGTFTVSTLKAYGTIRARRVR